MYTNREIWNQLWEKKNWAGIYEVKTPYSLSSIVAILSDEIIYFYHDGEFFMTLENYHPYQPVICNYANIENEKLEKMYLYFIARLFNHSMEY